MKRVPIVLPGDLPPRLCPNMCLKASVELQIHTLGFRMYLTLSHALQVDGTKFRLSRRSLFSDKSSGNGSREKPGMAENGRPVRKPKPAPPPPGTILRQGRTHFNRIPQHLSDRKGRSSSEFQKEEAVHAWRAPKSQARASLS